jgi:hypothetical protein
MTVAGSDTQKSIDYSEGTDKRVYWVKKIEQNNAISSLQKNTYIFFITDEATNPGFKCNWSIQKNGTHKVKNKISCS